MFPYMPEYHFKLLGEDEGGRENSRPDHRGVTKPQGQGPGTGPENNEAGEEEGFSVDRTTGACHCVKIIESRQTLYLQLFVCFLIYLDILDIFKV